MKTTLFRPILILVLITLSYSCTKQLNNELPAHLKKLDNLKTYSSNIEASNKIKLTPDQTFGDTDTIFFKRIPQFDVDGQGRVYIPRDSILVFNQNGKYLFAIGNEGKGPGEFQTIANLDIYNNKLFVYDAMSKRLTKIDLKTLNPIDDVILSLVEKLSTKGVFFIVNDSTIISEYEDIWKPGSSRFKYLFPINLSRGDLISSEPIQKQQIKSVFRKESGDRFQQGEFPFSRTTINTLSSDNNIYSLNTDNILIKVYDINGQYLRSFYHDFGNIQIDYDTFFDLVSLKKSDLPNFNFPETWPAVHSMVMDDRDRIWLSTIIENEEVYKWWVLSKEGKLLGQFRWPRSKEIKVVKKDKVYALEEDPESGVDSIVRYNMILSPTYN